MISRMMRVPIPVQQRQSSYSILFLIIISIRISSLSNQHLSIQIIKQLIIHRHIIQLKMFLMIQIWLIITVTVQMGNENLTIQQQPVPIQKLQITHIGTTTQMRLDHQQCLLKVLSFADHYLMQDCHRKLKARVGKTNSSVINIYQINKKQYKEICAHNFQLLVFMQEFNSSLKEHLCKRLQMKKNYTEQELFTFLAQTIEALIFIQDNGLKNIQLDCQSIVYSGQNVKILDSGVAQSKTYHDLLSCLEKGLKIDCNLYLAPELLKELQDQNYDPYISPKADIFSLGMIIMEMVGLQSMMGYYDYRKASIDYDSLIHRLSRVNHSLPFKTLIAEMLQYDPQQRIGLISLKQKVQRLRIPQQSMSRSKSSKMLQDILSNSRKSGSLCKHTERSCSLKRNQSSQKKMNRIQLRCSSKKNEEIKMETQPSAIPLVLTDRNANISNLPEPDPKDLKNLVKNKLKSKESKNSQSSRQPFPQPKMMLQSRNTLEQSNKNFQSSITSQKLGISMGSKKQNRKGVRSTLNKLVEESGIKKLLKIQQLEMGTYKNSQESAKHTSRFGSSQQHTNNERANYSKDANFYTNQYKENSSQIETVVYTEHQRLQSHQTLHKVMTFNKQLILNARSVQNSIQHFSRVMDSSSPSKLSLSPINHNPPSQPQSIYKHITIEDVPVVVSQQKTPQPQRNIKNFGQMQRQLNLFEEVRQGQSINTSINNTSNVIETFKPNQEDYSSIKESPFYDNSALFKKQRSKKPNLVIEIDNQQHESSPIIHQPSREIQGNSINAAQMDYLSNFTSISPPKNKEQSIMNGTQIDYEKSEYLETSLRNKVTLASGEEYEGQMLGEIPHGNGILYQEGKVKYSGSFKFGKYSGYGTLYNINFCSDQVDYRHIDLLKAYWSRFEGEFENGSMTGFGTIFFDNEKFSGCLKNGVIQGYGCFYGKKGQLVSGLWSQNKYRKV